ncbi:PhzF family phenazine biosynthesis isomerase [Paenibacillus gallinarum]|uniref:PhzF family phenazine biosynthesis isomerase n=1 Tax=Paenibacillus gallinarum TaxID=2762232 RepID=A0ABR8ST95_9BACL|nr:PhzF family phenazine biosynthesis isomerase [Paenibacillus gallinarum]MBD7966712.1 PhzF family phenazine biosynthesis isomerase [Paenibacillus gallinarum]
MRYRKVLHYDAFSSKPNKGNPAGVVLNADDLDEESMQSIARSVGFNETVFVLRSEKADVRLRYFTPGHEINLCGHATIAAMYCLKTLGILDVDQNEIGVETNVGVLPIFFETRDGEHFITMKQDKPRFTPFQGSISKLAESIGITEEEIDATMPIVFGSTGTWTLLLPIKNVHSFSKMKPTNSMFPEILTQNSKASIHPFSLETVDENAFMHARHFSSPYSGTIEDAITGTASGVMGAYYLTYLNQNVSEVNFLVEQGQEVGREGSVWVTVNRGEQNMDVYVSGTGVYVREFEVSYALAEERV